MPLRGAAPPAPPAQPGTDFDLSAPLALLRLAWSFQVAQAVYVAAQLGLADHLGADQKATAEPARETGMHAPTLHRLLRVLAASDSGERRPRRT